MDPSARVLKNKHVDSTASYEITLEGGKPWGIRLQGGRDHAQPLKVGQVTPSSKADKKGILTGEDIIAINGHDTTNILQGEAMNLIKETGDELKIRFSPNQQSTENDEDFFADLRDQFSGCGNTKKEASTTFQMLQEHMDSGNAFRVLSAFDAPKPDRNKSIVASANTKMRNLNEQGDYEAVMEGGKPWGIRLQGGKGTDMPLQIAQVTARGKGERMGLIIGDIILSINDTDVGGLTLVEAQNIIKGTGESLYILLKGDTTYHVKDAFEEERDGNLENLIKKDADWEFRQKIKPVGFVPRKKEVGAGVFAKPAKSTAQPEHTTVMLNQPMGVSGQTYRK